VRTGDSLPDQCRHGLRGGLFHGSAFFFDARFLGLTVAYATVFLEVPALRPGWSLSAPAVQLGRLVACGWRQRIPWVSSGMPKPLVAWSTGAKIVPGLFEGGDYVSFTF